MKKTPVWLVSLQVPAWQDWGTGPTGQRLGGTSDGVPNGAAGNSDARARALEAAERRQVPQGVSKEKAKEMTEQKQRETWHAMVSFRWWLGNMFGVSWKNCEIIVGWYDIHCIQLETLIVFREMETVSFTSDVCCVETASRQRFVMEVAWRADDKAIEFREAHAWKKRAIRSVLQVCV